MFHKSTIFGPVPSRRLGLSLGIDLIPYKTCCFDCVYCQLGRTTRKTVRRLTHVPVCRILHELTSRLARGGRIDWITLAGSGEPTLYSEIGALIRAIKRMTDIPVAVLTSGALLNRPAVRKELRFADLVIPDLDAGSARTFQKINRPHHSLNFQVMVKGIRDFVAKFPGRVWLEVALVRGVNDAPSELAKIGSLAARIRPERLQLNTMARPPAERTALPLSAKALERARLIIQRPLGGIPVDIITASPSRGHAAPARLIDGELLA
ncbi:MAG: radical SAM protein, partial [Candidatus Aureabacteria bacterium]|nr:radical SAM protein [Candidatus Auribacterota bacterium]